MVNQHFNTVQNGQVYSQHFESRPEFLFGNVVPQVIDANVKEGLVHGLKVARIEDVFADHNQTFLVFGKPNTALVMGHQDGSGYERFSAYSLWRQGADIVNITRNSGSIVQSGVWLRFFDLPSHAKDKLREGMEKFKDTKHITCVRGNMHVMEFAGFTSGKKKLSKIIWPHQLMTLLLKYGLFFEGKPVSYEVIRTTRLSMEDYARSIMMAEIVTPWRHYKKTKMARPMIAVAGLPSRLNHREKVLQDTVISEVAPALPSDPVYLQDIRVRVTSAPTTGQMLRQVWGPHALFEALVERVNIDDYVSRALRPFPQKNPPFITRLKKRVLFSKPVIWQMRRTLGASRFQEVGVFNEVDVYDTLRTDSSSASNVYNAIIVRMPSAEAGQNPTARFIIARVTVRSKFIDWILSKHVLMSGYLWYPKKDGQEADHTKPYVVWAGEFRKTADGTIRISGNSGTYQPTEEEDDAIVAMTQAILPHLKVEKAERPTIITTSK